MSSQLETKKEIGSIASYCPMLKSEGNRESGIVPASDAKKSEVSYRVSGLDKTMIGGKVLSLVQQPAISRVSYGVSFSSHHHRTGNC